MKQLMEKVELSDLFIAESVAVIGASQDDSKAGKQLLRRLLEVGYEGKIFPVNPKEKEILGQTCYPSLTAIRDSVDLLIIAVSEAHVRKVMLEAEERGDVKGAVIISAGFAETGVPELAAAQHEIVKIAKRAGIRVFGPNCVGVANTENRLITSFSPGAKLIPGNIGYVTQSGAIGGALLMVAGDQPHPLGFAKFGHVGNMCDVSNLELIELFGKDQQISAIAVYMEGVKDGRKLMDIAAKASERKPILILKVGRSDIGAKAALSHTGSLAGSDKVYDGAFKQCGMTRVDSVQEMTDGIKALSLFPKPGGNRVCILTEAGGMGIISMDAISQSQLDLASMSAVTRQQLERILPSMAMICKPNGYVDMTAAVMPQQQADALALILADPQVDMVIVNGLPPIFRSALDIAQHLVPVIKNAGKPVAVCFMQGEPMNDARKYLEENRVATFETPERAAKALEVLYRAAFRTGGPLEKVTPISENHLLTLAAAEARNLVEPEVLQFLKEEGFPTLPFRLAASREEVERASDELGYPVVLKIVSPQIIHKSDVGGVRVNLCTQSEAGQAFEEMISTVQDRVPSANIHGVLVVPQAKSGTEVIIGVSRDDQFGPIVMFGLGGTFVEVFKDVVFRVGPFNKEVAMDMIKETKAYEILKGVRGESRKDIHALAELLAHISQLAAQYPIIKEMDLNPVRVYQNGLAVLDARIIIDVPKNNSLH